MADLEQHQMRIPKDFASRAEFRSIEAEAGFPVACAVLLVLWRELGYLAEIQRLGFLNVSQMDRAIVREFKNPTGSPFETDPVAGLLRSKLVFECDGGFECRLFASLNQELSPDFAGYGRKGAFMSKLTYQRRKIQELTLKQSIQFDRAMFVKPDGNQMSDEEMRRVIMLVRLIDNQFVRAPRSPLEFTPGLINDAFLAMTKHSDLMINGVCFWLNRKKRVDSSGPTRTEDALRIFDQLVKSYGKIGLNQKQKREHARIAA